MHASPRSNHSEHAPCAQQHTNKHTHALPRSNHSDRMMRLVHNNTQTSTQAHAGIASQQSQSACAMCTRIHKQAHKHTRMHCLAALSVTASCAMCTRTHKIKNTHALPRSNHSDHPPCAQEHTNKHTHASPHSNYCEHMPCTSPNTLSHTCMHRLAAINHNEHAPCATSPNTLSHIHMHHLKRMAVNISLICLAKKNTTYT
jgi:hypothetical protein